MTDSVINMKSDLAILSQTTSEIKNSIQLLNLEQTKIKQQVTDLDEKCKILSEELTSVQTASQFTTDLQIDLQKQIENLKRQNQESADLQNTVSKLVTKIDTMEQFARECNIELCNIPEKRSENLTIIFENICTKINFSVARKEIVAIHRVPHAHQQNDKPKNIIVKLSSRILRDNILSAYRLHKRLKVEDIGFSNSTLPIYAHEHLTLKNKQLFRECREAAIKNNYKYVWIKNGTILAREREGARVVAIKSHHDISKIKCSLPKSNI